MTVRLPTRVPLFSSRATRGTVAAALVLPLLLLAPVGAAGPSPALAPVAEHGGSVPAPGPAPMSQPVPASPPPIQGLGSPAVAPPPKWISVTNPNDTPTDSFGGAMAFDPTDNQTVYFGGCAEYLCFENQTWVFAHGTWTNVTNPHDAPPASWYPAMDYDANMGGVLLFGGENNLGSFQDTTWFYHGGVWTNVTWVSTTNPPTLLAPTMAFDPAPEENGSVLFGGVNGATDADSSETWIWEGWSGWVELSPSFSPPGTAYAAMAYDPADQEVVLYGAGQADSTWELYSGQWWDVAPPGSTPAYRSSAQMVWDPELSVLVLFGGAYYPNEYAETWTFNGVRWSELSEPVAPPARDSAGFALDPTGHVPILFGGENFTTYAFNDTWVFETPLSATLGVAPISTEAVAPVTLSATVTGGLPPYTLTFSFGDNTSDVVTSSSSTVNVTHLYPGPGRFATSLIVSDNVGVTNQSTGPTVTITASPVVSASVAPAATDVGRALAFSATTKPAGAPPVNFTWRFGDNATGYGANASHAYAASGSYTANVTAVDALGARSTASLAVTVNPLPSVTIAPNRTSSSPGEPVLFSSSVTGGTGPFRYAWQFGDGATSGFASPDHVFASGGTYTVVLWVNDSVGGSAHQSLSFTVSGPGPSSSSSSAAPPVWFWAGLAALLVVAVVGAFLLLRRRRRPGPPG